MVRTLHLRRRRSRHRPVDRCSIWTLHCLTLQCGRRPHAQERAAGSNPRRCPRPWRHRGDRFRILLPESEPGRGQVRILFARQREDYLALILRPPYTFLPYSWRFHPIRAVPLPSRTDRGRAVSLFRGFLHGFLVNADNHRRVNRIRLVLARVIVEPLVHDFSVLPLRHRNCSTWPGSPPVVTKSLVDS